MSNSMQKIGASILDMIETLAISLSIFLVVYLFFLQPHEVDGQSMEPNFESGEHVLTDKVTYRIREPARGEVVVFHAPSEAHCAEGTGCDFIKRIIGVPGDSIEVHDNAIWVNGVALEEDYIPDTFPIDPANATKNKTIYLGADEYFVCGDNRPYSSDSRAWGPIEKTDIIGRVFFRYWPVGAVSGIKSAQYSLSY